MIEPRPDVIQKIARTAGPLIPTRNMRNKRVITKTHKDTETVRVTEEEPDLVTHMIDKVALRRLITGRAAATAAPQGPDDHHETEIPVTNDLKPDQEVMPHFHQVEDLDSK